MKSKKPKILFIAPFPPPYAGPENSAKTFLESDLNNQFDIIKFNTNFRNSNADKGRVGLKMVSAFFKLNRKLIVVLTKEKPDIVYFYVTATILGWIGKDIWVIFLSKLLGSKVVIHMRAGHFRRNFDRTNNVFKWIISNSLNRVDYNLAQSFSLAQQYSGVVKDSNKIGFIYNMIDISKYACIDNTQYDENIILFLGHLSHAKGYNDILKVIPRISIKYPKIKFVFAGTKKEIERNITFNDSTGESILFENPENVYKEYIKGKFEKNYQYLGQLGENDKISWLKKCNFFLLPSYSEGFSTAVLEGIATGKPILTTPVGGLKDVIKHNVNGLLVLPGELNNLENAILELLGNNALRNQIAYNNILYRKNFYIKNIEDKYSDIFHSLL
ncbi:glycosyltransferase family 4 protein [Psychroserpens jangbogonensis]|uniref:glycosyltransferase family 4 protein n=1 Tax=Psychroserpens jangbogonensis TaxID=1484460 RepID=UPI00053DBDB5|nr:glycosyltransferase family 4 protein [Psychroserpens jangbogonensis]